MNNLPLVFAIILNWNGYEDTIACIESVQKSSYSNFKILIIDNASTDGSVDKIKRIFPSVDLIVNNSNIGYAGGNNIGILRAMSEKSDFVLILNNDTIINSDAIGKMVEFSMNMHGIGLVGPKVMYSDSNVIQSIGITNIIHNTGHNIGHGEEDSGRYREPLEVDAVNGSAMLISREVIDNVGLIDETFFLYYEDTDYCMRVSQKGYKIYSVPLAVVWHKEMASGDKVKPLIQYLIQRNKLRFVSRYYSKSQLVNFVMLNYLIYLPKTILSLTFKKRDIKSAVAALRGSIRGAALIKNERQAHR